MDWMDQEKESWIHVVGFVLLMILMVVVAVVLGRHFKDKDYSSKNKVLIWTAILIDAIEILKIVIYCLLDGSFEPITRLLPLFLCSIQLIAIPVAAFSKGKLKNAALDFVVIFGVLGALAGTYGAAQNYAAYPVLSYPNIHSGINHAMSGFASLYILFSGMASMKRKNITLCLTILTAFCVMAYVANIILDYNYMFLMAGDGTPYDIFYNLVGGSPILYPLLVVALFYVYIIIFYAVYFAVERCASRQIVLKPVSDHTESQDIEIMGNEEIIP